MKKNLRRQRTLQVLPAAIALSLGVIAPFAPPQCAFADNSDHYIIGGGGSTFFKSDIQSATQTYDKVFTLAPSSGKTNLGKNGNTTLNAAITGVGGLTSAGKQMTNLQAQSGDYIGLALKCKDANGNNIYRIISYAEFGKKATADTKVGSDVDIIDRYNIDVISTDEVQKKLKIAVEKNTVSEFMKEYLPEIAVLKLTAAEVKNLQGSTDNGWVLSEEKYKTGTQSLYDNSNLELKWLFEYNKLQEPDSSAATTTTTYTYDRYDVQQGGLWRPEDRTLYTVIDGGPAGKFQISTEWSLDCKDKIATGAGNDIGEANGKPVDPLNDNEKTVISVKELTTGADSMIDLSYVNTSGSSPLVYQANGERVGIDYSKELDGQIYQATSHVSIERYLRVEQAKLGNNTTFRLGVYGFEEISGNAKRRNDAVYITNAINAGGTTNLNIQLGWVPEIKEESMGGVWENPGLSFSEQNAANQNTLLGIYEGAENFTVTAQESEVDGIFSTYLVLPDIVRYDDFFDTVGDDGGKHGTAWYLKGYTYVSTGEMAESGKSVSENSTVQNNFVKANNLSLFRRSENLHGGRLNRQEAGGNGPQHDESGLAGELRENLWADVWHGKFDAKAAYARSTNQSYNGFQVGYDKLLSKKFYGGKVYTGFYASKIDGKSTTAAGKGEQDSYGVGVYSSWVGDKGHFIDLGVNAFKLKNDYHFTGNTGNGSIGKVKGENSTWAYGIGAQYGKRNELSSNWFWEPSVSLYVGHVDESSYKLTNGLGVHEQGYDTAIGKLGLKAGKNIGDKGNIYAGVSWGHEFAGGQKLHQSYGALNRLVETVGGSDSWWEWNVGGKVKLSPNAALNLDFIKTTGSDVGNEWSINGGLDFSWGGFGSGGSKAAKVNASGGEPSVNGGGFAKANAPTVVVGQSPKVGNVQVPQMQQAQQSVAVESGSADSRAVYDMGEAGSSVIRDDTGSVSGTVTGGMGEFELGGLTVEAKRPDWEKNLSPGQVSVIYPAQFEGEQKNLPELLDRVPGLFIQRVNGAGHYTVARVRGSTAAQVSVYVDGVQMNLTGDAAVNLSAIPADNIERIEVYRGYVPARFAGAPLGGVINIITKKPNEGHGHITQGVKSYGGYSSTYEYSMPLGSGSLLATYARDIWQGDFDYLVPNSRRQGGYTEYKRRSNGYQNNNGMLKWQDDHWTIKGVWKKQHEELAKAIIKDESVSNVAATNRGYRDGEMDIDYKELLIGRRDTWGNLDLGWHIAYLDSKKTYTNIGGYRQLADSEIAKKNGELTLGDGIGVINEGAFSPGQLWGIYHSKKWNGNLNLAFKAGNNHLLEFNGDFTRETMDANGNSWGLSQATNGLLPNTETNFVRAMLYKYNNREYHLTLQDTITLNDDGDFKLTPILRADKVEMEGLGPSGTEDDRWMYSGGVALQKQLNDHWSFKSTWGTYNRHPNFYEIFGDGGFIRGNYVYKNADGIIDQGLWETGSQFDFSLNWQGKLAGADTDTILTYYQRKAENQLVLWTPMGGDGLSCYAPTGDTKTYGIELAHNMKWQRLNLSLAATWQKSKQLDEGLGSGFNWQKNSSSFVPEWVVSARLDYLFPGDKLNVFGEYRYTDHEVLRGDSSSEGFQIRDSYSIIDLGVKYKFNKKWRLSAGVNDVFDKGQEVFIKRESFNGDVAYPNFYPLAGRMYYTTLEYSF